MRSASSSVSWSPSMTATGRRPSRPRMVRSSSVVLPAPGELVRLKASDVAFGEPCPIQLGELIVLCQHPLLERDGLGVGVFVWMVMLVWMVVVVVVVRSVGFAWLCRSARRASAHRRDGDAVVTAAAGRAHDQLTSIERIFRSRPASTSTSALPQGHNRDRVGQLEVRRAAAAAGRAGADVEVELGAVGDGALGREVEAERHGVGHDGTQCADLQLHAVHAAACGVFAHRFDKTLRQRHFVHVCPALGSDEPHDRSSRPKRRADDGIVIQRRRRDSRPSTTCGVST